MTIVLYATDTMADWEYGYLVAGLGMAGRRPVIASESGGTVTTMGGIKIAPDAALADLSEADLTALVLPGADTWASGHDAVLALATTLLASGIPVGAICGATLGLARTGALDERAHTSNAPEFLSQAIRYRGQAHYVNEKAVSDGTVITATATAPIEFAKLIFERLEVFPQPIVDAWYGLYTTGEKKYFDQLSGA